jgi:hypothetical protein
MTEDATRKLRQLDSETDAVWAERIRLIEDVRNVATSLFSLAEDACDRFPEDAEKGGATVAPGDDRWDVASGRQLAAAGVARAFIPGDEQHAVGAERA